MIIKKVIFFFLFLGTVSLTFAQSELPADMQGLALPALIWATTLFMMWYALRMKAAGVLK